MVSVPGFLLKRLYQRGSLKNNDTGFEFQLGNRLGSGYAHGCCLWRLTEKKRRLAARCSYWTALPRRSTR